MRVAQLDLRPYCCGGDKQHRPRGLLVAACQPLALKACLVIVALEMSGPPQQAAMSKHSTASKYGDIASLIECQNLLLLMGYKL